MILDIDTFSPFAWKSVLSCLFVTLVYTIFTCFFNSKTAVDRPYYRYVTHVPVNMLSFVDTGAKKSAYQPTSIAYKEITLDLLPNHCNRSRVISHSMRVPSFT